MTAPLLFRVIWPEERVVRAQKIAVWYRDALEAGRVPKRNMCGRPVIEKALALHEAGVITLGDLRR